MCGIAGFTYSPGTWRPEDAARIVSAMIGRLVHRGPDASGVWSANGIALGHRRLSIIDLAGGAQPMADPDSGRCIVFNGEIYNYLQLNAELKRFGMSIRTRSDTETVLKAYSVWGEECLGRFNGMFAFVLYDPRTGKLFGARDRLGKKPLYYSHQNQLLVFGSEPKALLAHPAVSRELDWEAAARYLMHEYVPAPYSIYAGMRKLHAGHKFSFNPATGALIVRPYWDCNFDHDLPAGELHSAEAWTERIRSALVAAVKARLVSDVPLGVFLSGGVDSSAVVAAMASLHTAGKVKTFSIGFNDRSFDESAHARYVAGVLGTDHHEMILDPHASLEIIPIMDRVFDEPFADASVLPSYLVARFARQSVTVVLGGDGGDELFAGYDTFRALRAARLYNKVVPAILDKTVLRPIIHRMPVSTANFSFDFVARQFLRGVKVTGAERLWRWLGAFNPEELTGLLTPDFLSKIEPEALYEEVRAVHDKVAYLDPVTQDLYGYTKTYLPDDLMVKLDRATMACSLEARCPLLDVQFVELANSIPGSLKCTSAGRLKHVFKEALRGLVPDKILCRPKKGFGVPLAAWFRGPLREPLWDSLAEHRLRQQGFFRPEAVRRLLRDHDAGKANNRKPLMTLFMFQRWLDNWSRDQIREDATVPLVPEVRSASAPLNERESRTHA